MTSPASLTMTEAARRAALLSVRRYDIHVDMSGLLEGSVISAVSTIAFSCREPGSDTFVDCVGRIGRAILNDRELDLSSVVGGRLPLTDLAADNVLVVESSQDDTASSTGILRTVDPADQLVYVWTSFEPDDARRLWACFDQPDLKASHALTVDAPESWTVLSNSPPESVEASAQLDAVRVWRFAETPPLSTYVVVVNAGPFVEVRSPRGGYDLGLFARQSLSAFLRRDAEELFDLTARGLVFFGEQFDLRFPQTRYDQVFVPNLGGAMENWGCVTYTDAFLFRSAPTYAQRCGRADVVLHEMAHMWFGDLVTMTWWNDLWLNEAFADWAANWALAQATEFTDAWAGFCVSGKVEAYGADMSPGTHPIRSEVPDVAGALANFDAITYRKGQSVLKQLAAYVGNDAFVAGLRTYFADHAWSNTVLQDLMSAVGAAAGRDLTEWTSAWLDRAGTDTIHLTGRELRIESGDDLEPRSHRLNLRSFVSGSAGLREIGELSVETSGHRATIDLPTADLHLLNADDLTFAAVRPDAESLALLLPRIGELPDPLWRAVAGAIAWDRLVKGECSASEVVATLTFALPTETSPIVVESFLALALRAAEQWAPDHRVEALTGQLASVATTLAATQQFARPALRILAATARTPEQFTVVGGHAESDPDLAWRLLARRAELGDYDEAGVAALESADPDPESWVRALGVRAARPVEAAKEEAFTALLVDRIVPAGTAQLQLGALFWRPGQASLLRPYADRYLDALGSVISGGLLSAGALIRSMFPLVVADQGFIDRTLRLANDPATHPHVQRSLLVGADTATRILAARGYR